MNASLHIPKGNPVSRSPHGALVLIFATLLLPLAALAQGSVPADNPAVRRGLDDIKSFNAWTLEQQVSICEIPAPGFKEKVRGAEFRKRLAALAGVVRGVTP